MREEERKEGEKERKKKGRIAAKYFRDILTVKNPQFPLASCFPFLIMNKYISCALWKRALT